jgi:hypothetical protein
MIAVDVGSETKRKIIPKCADISINGIYLDDPQSTERILGPNIPPVENPLGPHFFYNIFNNKKSEMLSLIIHPGDIRHTISEFKVRKPLKVDKMTIHLTKIDYFISGKGIRLGLKKKQVTDILGSSFIETKSGNITTLKYKLDDFSQSEFLQSYNMPIYYGEYKFEDDKLIEFAFGFQYP